MSQPPTYQSQSPGRQPNPNPQYSQSVYNPQELQQLYISKVMSDFRTLEDKKSRKFEGNSNYRDLLYSANKKNEHLESRIDMKMPLRMQKIGKKMHKSLFRNARFEESKEGVVIHQQKQLKDGTTVTKKSFPIKFCSVQRFAQHLNKKSESNHLGWDKKEQNSYRLQYTTPKHKDPLALYFNSPIETYEFLVKSDVDLRASICRMLDEYKRRKDEARVNIVKNGLLERIRSYAESKKRKNLSFLEEFDTRITRDMLVNWLKMSRALEQQRYKMAQEVEVKPNDTSIHQQEDVDPFEESRRLIEQRMREREEEERRREEEEKLRLKLLMLQQYVESIRKNHAFLDCNHFHLNRFAREWRRAALEQQQKMKIVEQSAKFRPETKNVYIKVMEINQSIISEPLLTISLLKPPDGKESFKPIQAKTDKTTMFHNNNDRDDFYHDQQFGLRVSGQVKNVRLVQSQQIDPSLDNQQILWEITNNALSWHLGVNSHPSSRNLEPKDMIVFSLSHEYQDKKRNTFENEAQYTAKIRITDLLKETFPLKVYYLTLNEDNGAKKPASFLEPLIKFKVFLGDDAPSEQDWERDLVRDIKANTFIKDPVYDEIIRLPKYTPKNSGFLIEILRSWGVFDIEMNYRRLIEDFKEKEEAGTVFNEYELASPEVKAVYQPPMKKKLLQEIIENLYDFTIEETSRSHARSQGNLNRFQTFEKNAIEYLYKKTPPNSPYKKDFGSEDNEENSFEGKEKAEDERQLLKLRSRNEGKIDDKSLKMLEEICRKGGVPNHKRPFLWSFLGNVEEIKLKAVTFYNSSLRLNSYENSKQPSAADLDKDISLSAFYFKLLDMARRSDLCYLIRQQIADDIALVNESEDYANQELEYPLSNILSALAFLIEMLKSHNPQHLDQKKNVFYSLPVMKITRKIIAIIQSRYLDPEHMNLDVFQKENVDNPGSSHHKKKFEPQPIEANNHEFLAFWMLVSMISHILPGYFIGMPHELNKEIKTPLRESYQDEIGLKRDLLILKFYIKEHEPAIFQLFEDISLPLEFFYGNMLLSAGSDMIHNEVLYRIWDLLFLQKEKKEDPHLVLISLVILILRISKDHILRGSGKETKHASKDSREINDVIKIFETVSRFLPNPDEVVEELIRINEDLLKFIRHHYGEFNNIRNELNNRFQNTRHQNKMFYDLIHHKNNFEELKENVGVLEIFQLLETLKQRHKLFQSTYKVDAELSVPDEFDGYENVEGRERKELNQLVWFKHFDWRNDPNMIIHLYLHKMTLFNSREENPFKLEVLYQDESKAILPLEFNTSSYLNHYIQIPYNYRGKHQIKLQITLEREWIPNLKSPKTTTSFREINTNKTTDTMSSQNQIAELRKFVVKEAYINLDSFLVNYLQKGIAKLDFTPEEVNLNEDYNLSTSEIDFSLVISTEHISGVQENIENTFRNNAKLLAQNLPKPMFKVQEFEKIRDVNLERFHEKFLKSLINVLGLEHISNTSFAINPNQWRKNSKITYEQFRQTLKESRFVEGVPLDYFALYNSIMNANREKTFYFTDFMILLILFSHTTPKQKALLLYDTLQLFDDTKDLCNGVSIMTVKSMISYLYETFMLSMPHHQVDNIIEFLTDGYVSGVISAKLDFKVDEKQEKIPMTLNFTNTLIHVTNYLHYYYNTKHLFLGEPNKLNLLKEVLENLNEEMRDILDLIPNNELLRLNVKYRLRGMKHKIQMLFDKNWEIKRKLVLDPELADLKIQNPESYKLIESLLLQNENVVPMGNFESFLNKNQFILLMEKLPMMNYFLSFSIFENNVAHLPKISCSIRLDNDLIGHIENLSLQNQEFKSEYNAEYKNLSYLWQQTRGYISDQRIKNLGAHPSQLEMPKFPFYDSFFNTLKLIQIKIMDTYLHGKEIHGNAELITSSVIKSNNNNLTSSATINKGKKAPEYSKIFDVDFRKVVLEMFCEDQNVSGLFYCSLFDLAWLVSKNLKGIKGSELKLVIKYFSKTSEKNKVIPQKPEIITFDPFKRFEQKYQCLALYFYSYQAKEWLPCKIEQRFYSKRRKLNKNPLCSYYGVRFQNEPERIYLKRKNEIYIPTYVDVNEIVEGNLKEREVGVHTKDVVSTKVERKAIEPLAPTKLKDVSTMKEATREDVKTEQEQLMKSFIQSKTSGENEKEKEKDDYGNPLSTRSNKTDPKKSSFAKNVNEKSSEKDRKYFEKDLFEKDRFGGKGYMEKIGENNSESMNNSGVDEWGASGSKKYKGYF